MRLGIQIVLKCVKIVLAKTEYFKDSLVGTKHDCIVNLKKGGDKFRERKLIACFVGVMLKQTNLVLIDLFCYFVKNKRSFLINLIITRSHTELLPF